jgi:hypothetical protein
MKIHLLVVAFFAAVIATNAQAPKVPSGLKFKVLTESNNVRSLSFMGQDVEFSVGTQMHEICELTSVSADGYHLSSAITRINGYANAMGAKQTFDSDNANKKLFLLNDEQLKVLKKPIDYTIEKGKVSAASAAGSDILNTILFQLNGSSDQAKYFLTLPAASLKPAYQWSSAISTKDAMAESLYVITEINATDINVNVLTNVKLNTTLNFSGMNFKDSTQGTIKAKRIYDARTGLLKSETATGALKGTMNVMGQDAPIDLKVTTKSSVVPM